MLLDRSLLSCYLHSQSQSVTGNKQPNVEFFHHLFSINWFSEPKKLSNSSWLGIETSLFVINCLVTTWSFELPLAHCTSFTLLKPWAVMWNFGLISHSFVGMLLVPRNGSDLGLEHQLADRWRSYRKALKDLEIEATSYWQTIQRIFVGWGPLSLMSRRIM